MMRLQKLSLGGAGTLIIAVALGLLLQSDGRISARGEQASTESASVAVPGGDSTSPSRRASDKSSADKGLNSTENPLELDIDPSKLTKGDLQLALTVTPSCAVRGQSMAAKLLAVPGAYVSLIVAYSDGQSFGAMYAGPVGVDGSLTYPWVIPPTAAFGKGWVFATGHDPATEKSGRTGATFTVGGVQGC